MSGLLCSKCSNDNQLEKKGINVYQIWKRKKKGAIARNNTFPYIFAL